MRVGILNIRKLYFGRSSAEDDIDSDPERFYNSFYDRWELRARSLDPSFFLIVGPKGAGKTAISEYMRMALVSKFGDHAVFARTLNLDEVSPNVSPISAITQKLVSNETAGLTDSAWRLFLSLRILELLANDQSCSITADGRVLTLMDTLSNSGLVTSDFPTVLRRVRENKGAISIKGILGREWASKDTDEVSVSNLGNALTHLIVNARSRNVFRLSIDGLDRIIGDNPAYWRTLAALLRVSDDLHKKLRSANANIRVLVMCRSDVLRRIKFADADKIEPLNVDWHIQQGAARDSHLWDYVSAKAGLTPGELFSLLPRTIPAEQGTGSQQTIDIAEYLLQLTRSTPRETTLLMKRIQDEVPVGGWVTAPRVRAAAANFSSCDLMKIVSAEATGTLEEALHDRLEEIISSLPVARGLTEEDFKKALVSAGLTESLLGPLLEFLFLAGLLGNFHPSTYRAQFYHQREICKLKRSGPWALSSGMTQAFGIHHSRSPRKSAHR